MIAAPERSEAAEYFQTYISQVGAGDIREILTTQAAETVTLLKSVSEQQSMHKYAADKWTIREVVSHINDTERVFVFRALWFARGFADPLPSFDQNIAIASAGANDRLLASHVEEFRAVREATNTFFKSLTDEAWMRRGVASGNPFTVRALAYITAGHVAHHVRILKERYL
jgi:DinB family protein